jgi:hypothetical protein
VSLKAFHIVFVTLSTLLCLVFGGWSLHRYATLGGGGLLATTLLSFVAAGVLIVYGLWFRRKITSPEEENRRRRKFIRRVPAMLAVMLLADRAAHACSVCYGEADGPMIDGARSGVYMMFGLVLLMQIAFGSFFIVLWRRSRDAEAEHPESETRSH